MTGVLHICVAMKPLDGNFAENALKHGVAGLNIDGCRVEAPGEEDGERNRPPSRLGSERTYAQDKWTASAVVCRQDTTGKGRWPANVIHDGSDAVLGAFPFTKSGNHNGNYTRHTSKTKNAYGEREAVAETRPGDSGSAARFFKQMGEFKS